MRFHTTTGFQNALTTATELRRRWTALPDETPDAESEPLGDEADAAIDRVLMMPAVTAKEISEKLVLIQDRYEGLSIDDMKKELSQLRADLDTLTRPNVSPPVVTAFEAFAAAHKALNETPFEDDDDPAFTAICDAHGAALAALFGTPCTTPGDFMVKTYVHLLGELGGTFRSYASAKKGGFTFELAEIDTTHRLSPQGEIQHDAAAEIALRRDLLDSDLGRCLCALGRVDFDAEAWIAAAERWGHGFAVTVGEDGRRTFGQNIGGSHADEPDPEGWSPHRENLLLALLAGGLEASKSRISAVVEATIANHPDHVMRVAACPCAKVA